MVSSNNPELIPPGSGEPAGGEPVQAWINYDGALLPAGEKILTADSRGLRYGDGIFETMLVREGKIRLSDHHFDRLLSGIRFLQFDLPSFFTADHFSRLVLELCKKNGHSALARVRLVVFRGEGGLFDPADHWPHFIIQSFSLSGTINTFGGEGLVIDIFPDGRKSCDPLSNLKSNNYLLYVLAVLYAQKHQLHDCLVLNSQGRLADSTIANLFYISKGQFYTPALSEGCVAGVMRRYLLETLPRIGFTVHEVPVIPEDLLSADEVFLTNALKGITRVRSLRGVSYEHSLSDLVYKQLIENL